MIAFFLGVAVGTGLVLFIIYILVVDPWGPTTQPLQFIDQFKPIQVPDELKQFLKTGTDGQGISKWESCFSLSLFLHMFYQEHKDTRTLRRWMHKRLQMELNDIATRSAAGRLLQDIRIRDLSLGTKFPVVNAIRVENVEMSDDKNTFQNVTFLVDIDYTGGFETSIDVGTMFGRKANLSVKITKLAGLVRIILSRKPYNYWTMSFVSAPQLETDISSEIQGHQLKRLIPLIKESIKRALQRKHVWPNYKIRYRPVFPNPLLQASPPLTAFAHIKLEGGLEVTVLQCSRLKTDLVDKNENWEVYCTLAMDQRPFLQNNSQNVAHALSVMLVFSRYDLSEPIGMTFEKYSSSQGARPVQVATVEEGSLAEKALFKSGDTLVAINNVPIRSERQATRFLQQTTGDLMVLVERNLDDLDDDDLKEEEIMGNSGDPDDAFVSIDFQRGRSERKESTPTINSKRRHSVSVGPSLPSVASLVDTTDSHSVDSSLLSLDGRFEKPLGGTLVQRAESARVPHVLVSQPSLDLRRTRSESQLDAKTGSDVSSVNLTQESSMDVESPMDVKCIKQDSCAPPDDLNLLTTEQDITLKDPATGLPAASSTVSLLSTASGKTDNTDGDCDEEDIRFCRNRPASTRRQRISATFQAGKRKVLDFIPQKKRQNVTDDPVELGSEANECDLLDPEMRESHSRSPVPSGKRSPTESSITEKKDRNKKCKKKSSRSGVKNADESPTSSVGTIHSRTTKPVHFEQDVLWGQSLHFDLDGSLASRSGGCKYLNVTIHARQVISPTESSEVSEPKKPVLLGYTSLYIPQLIDDCRLTLSNCHREVFFLKPPTGLNTITDLNSSTTSEFARHAGFDPRLCYGDVTLGFRYFPNGLPTEANLNAGDACSNEPLEAETEEAVRSISPQLASAPSQHVWKPWTVKTAGTTCAMCRGKIWLKSANCCHRCLVICHIKCVEKANTGIICVPSSIVDNDNGFDDIESELSSINPIAPVAPVAPIPPAAPTNTEDECPVTVIYSPPQQSQPPLLGDTVDSISRRARLKSKVSEKLSYWRRGKKKEDNESETISRNSQSTIDSMATTTSDATSGGSPVTSIQDCVGDILRLLEGSPFINSLYFQPGNAYNEEIITNAKVLGKQIFAEYTGDERTQRVNQQIDVIQSAIRETKNGRLAAMKGEANSGVFEGLDERLQALAVLMLHYCSALQDCAHQGRATPEGVLEDDTSLNVFEDAPLVEKVNSESSELHSSSSLNEITLISEEEPLETSGTSTPEVTQLVE